LHHADFEKLSKNLEHLSKSILPADNEIIVINNGKKSFDQKQFGEKYPSLNIKFFETENAGYPAGNNFGLEQTKAKFYAFINADIYVFPDTFSKILNYMNAHEQIGVCSPRLVYPSGVIQDNYRSFPRAFDLFIKRIGFLRRMFPRRMRDYLLWDLDPHHNQAVDWVTGAFFVVSEKCLAKVKKHDDKYFLFMSDVVFCREAWEQGFEVHLCGEAEAIHDENRVSSGGVMDIFRKKTLRIHLSDAAKYFWNYFRKNIPPNAPSLSLPENKQRLLKAHRVSGRPFLSSTGKKLQNQNPVVSVFEAHVEGKKPYDQPVIFFGTGVVAVIKNLDGKIGLLKIWRHTPLHFKKKNTFPIFPDFGDLGIYSLEAPRGGMEKFDKSAKEAILRECYEEIGLEKSHIESIRESGKAIANTAIDVFHHRCFEIVVNEKFKFRCNDEADPIEDFRFYSQAEIMELIRDHKIVCALTQAAILQAFK
jgi:GT2 family glycosyltransferase/8-oxo-dGTP pyrophosphatase MutT (NUDIX family)